MFIKLADFAKILIEILSLRYAQKISRICKNWNLAVKEFMLNIIKNKVISTEFIPTKIKFTRKIMEDKKGLLHTVWLPVFDHQVLIRYLPKSKNEQRWLCYKFDKPKMDIIIKENYGYLYYDQNFNFSTQTEVYKLKNQMSADRLIPFLINKNTSMNITLYTNPVISTRVNMPPGNDDNTEISLPEFIARTAHKKKLNAILSIFHNS